jgi:hypothetical protein
MKNNTYHELDIRYYIRRPSMFHIFYKQGYGTIESSVGTVYYVKNYHKYVSLYSTYSYYLNMLYDK